MFQAARASVVSGPPTALPRPAETAPTWQKPAPTDDYDDLPRRRRRRHEDDFDDDDDDGDYRDDLRRNRYIQPHRGTVVLVLGILSVCCVGVPITGLIAWILGHVDVNAMNRGEMDPSGLGQTQTGKILGMVSTLLFGFILLGYCFIGIFAGAMRR
jgi:hypothetical protein